MSNPHEQCIAQCNSLLRGEISAVEAYDKALEKFATQLDSSQLASIRTEHQQSVSDLQQNVISMGGEPGTSSGAWGTLTGSIQQVSNLLGESSAVASLLQGEEHGRADYERALDNPDLMPECAQLIEESLLPRIARHISSLKALQQSHS